MAFDFGNLGWAGGKGDSGSGGGNFDFGSFENVISDRINQKQLEAKQSRKDEVERIRKAYLQEAADVMKPGNIAKDTFAAAKELVLNTLKGVGQGLAKIPIRIGESIIEVPYNIATGGKTFQRVLNVPGLGDVPSYQQEAAKTAEEIVGGEKPLYSALKPFGEVPLDIATMFLPGTAGAKIARKGIMPAVTEGAITGAKYGAAYGGMESVGEGQDIKNIIKSSIIGGITGLGVGAGLGGITSGLHSAIKGKVAEKIVEKTPIFEENKPIEPVGKDLSLRNFFEKVPNIKVEQVKNLGRDLENRGIASRFEWDYKKNEGKLIITPKTTEGDLAHEFAHYMDKVDPAIKADHKAEVITLSGGKQNLNEDFAMAIRKIITDPAAREKAPELTKIIENTGIKLSPEKTPEAKLLDKRELTGLRQTRNSYLADKEKFVSSYLNSEEGYKIFQKIEENQAKKENLGEINSDVLSGIKNNPYYRKERSIKDSMGSGWLLENPKGRKMIAASDQVDGLVQKGWKKRIEVDSLAQEAGFENGEDYLNYTLEQVEKNHSLSDPEKLAHEELLKSDENYKMLNEEIDKLTKTIKEKQYENSRGQEKISQSSDKTEKNAARTPAKKAENEKIAEKRNRVGFSKTEMQSVSESKLKRYEKLRLNRQDESTLTDVLTGDEISVQSKISGDPFKIYRVVPEGKEFMPGDFVFDNRKLAEEFLREQGEKRELKKIITREVTIDDLSLPIHWKEDTFQGEFLYNPSRNAPKAIRELGKRETDNYEKIVDKKAETVPVIREVAAERKNYSPFGPTPRKKVKTEGINWDSVNTSVDTENILNSIYESSNQFRDVRPSRTNKDIIEGARMVGIDVNDSSQLDALVRNFPNANVAHKLKQSLVDSASDLVNYLKTIDTATATTEELAKVKAKFLRTQGIAKAFSGLRTESSHLLRSMGIQVLEGENEILQDLAAGLKKLAAETGDKELTTDGIANFMKKSKDLIDPTWGDTALGIWYNAILSGWKTWSRNILDNTGILATETISKVANPTTMRESISFIGGILKSVPSSLYEAGKVLAGKASEESKLSMGKKFSPYFPNHPKLNLLLTEISGRMLNAQDIIFSSTLKKAEGIYNKFENSLIDAGIKDPEVIKRLNDAVLTQFSERNTYRNKPLGAIGKVSGGITSITGKVKALKIIIPFTRVVANVIDRKVDYTPFLNLFRTFGKKYLTEEAEVILKKASLPRSQWGELTPIITKRLKQQQLGRLYLGTLVSIGAVTMARNGKLSGSGPKDLNEKSQLQATGWRPYSMKIGKYWIPYIYLGPLSGILSAAGDINDAVKYGSPKKDILSKLANGVFGFVQSNLSQSFLSGVSDLMNTASGNTDPKKYIGRLATGLIPIPAFWTQTVQALDGKAYDNQTIGELIKYKLGMFKYLTPRLDALGDEMRNDVIYGLTPSSEKDNIQKQFENRGVTLSLPGKSTKLGNETMTRKQLWEYTKIRGEIIKNNLNKILGEVDKQKTQSDKDFEFSAWVQKAGEEAKVKMMKQYNIRDEKKDRRTPKTRNLK